MANPFPLAWGRDGGPLDVPQNAAGWRVRRLASSSRGGALEVVSSGGQPLICTLETTAAQLYELVKLVPGRYRLDAVDEDGRLVGVPPAYTTLSGSDDNEDEAPSTAATEYASLSRSLDAVERLASTNAETMKTMTAQLTAMITATARLVEAADAAGVTRRQAETTALAVQSKRSPVVDDEDDENEAKPAAPTPSPWVPIRTPVVEQLAPQIPALIQGVVGLIAANRALAQAKQSGAGK
jgi:hypothetical protein